MTYGYQGKILHVDLSSRKISIEKKDDAFYRKYLGGRGIGYYYFLNNVPARIDPASPENLLIMATGVMTGAPIAASCRFTVIGKSPLTNTIGESEAAGFFGPELKKAGFDAIVFRGKAEHPVYLWVNDGTAEIKDATHIADLDTGEAEDTIRAELNNNKIRVAQTGPAGMRGVLFANITNDLHHFNGRNGLGALMGLKNLRAVACRGTMKIPFADINFLKKEAKHYAQTFMAHPAGKFLYEFGTPGFTEFLSRAGALPVDNFRRSKLEDDTPISGKTYNEMLLKSRKGCYACPIRCKRHIEIKDDKYGVDSRYGGPEYETISAIGTNLNITDLKAISKGNEICSRYCMDTISAGMTIAFACECYEKGIITRTETGGIALRFGDADLMLQLLEMTAKREGFGNLLAEGMARLCKLWNVADAPFNLSVKGQEIAMHDPRLKVGVGLGYVLGTHGADHMNAAHDAYFVDEASFSVQSVKNLGIAAIPTTELSDQKIKNYIQLNNLWKMMDAIGLCVFGFAPRGVMPVETMVQCINAVTGWDVDIFELVKSGERTNMMARASSCREGFTIKDDILPKRLFDPMPDGPDTGKYMFSEKDFNEAVKHYYQLIDCDPVSGIPDKQKMSELGLAWIASKM